MSLPPPLPVLPLSLLATTTRKKLTRPALIIDSAIIFYHACTLLYIFTLTTCSKATWRHSKLICLMDSCIVSLPSCVIVGTFSPLKWHKCRCRHHFHYCHFLSRLRRWWKSSPALIVDFIIIFYDAFFSTFSLWQLVQKQLIEYWHCKLIHFTDYFTSILRHCWQILRGVSLSLSCCTLKLPHLKMTEATLCRYVL